MEALATMARKKKMYRVKYRIDGFPAYHYKYYSAMDKETAQTMFEAGFRHTHGDTVSSRLDYSELTVKRYGKWRSQ